MTPLSPLAQQTAARTHAAAPWRTWCCPLHFMGGFSPDRDARRGWLASAPGAADAAALPSFSDQTPKTRSAMCTADAALTAGLMQRLDAKRVLVFRWGPAPQQLVPAPRKETQNTGPWTPPRWTNEISRPGGEAHKQYGSLQADGTVRPYHAPVHGCVGSLKGRTDEGRG
jgi:hypothetical protein